MVGEAGEREEQIRQPVEIDQDLRRDRVVCGERHHAPLGAAANGAREMQLRSDLSVTLSDGKEIALVARGELFVSRRFEIEHVVNPKTIEKLAEYLKKLSKI